MPESTLTQNESNGGIITPTVLVWPVCIPLTSRLRRQPSSRDASSTRRQVSSPNRSRSPRRIREAAAKETLAAFATSLSRGTEELAIEDLRGWSGVLVESTFVGNDRSGTMPCRNRAGRQSVDRRNDQG